MTTLKEGPHTGEYILSEANGHLSRDNIKIKSGAGVVKPCTVLGKLTATGKFVPHNPGADPADGSEKAVAILYSQVDATSADALGVATVRDSEVRASELVLNGATDTDSEKAAVYASLAAVGIIVR